MLNYILIFVSVAFFCLNSAMTRLFQLKIGKNPRAIRLYQAGYCFIASLIPLLLKPELHFDWLEIGLAIPFGIIFCLCALISSICIEIGPMSLTSVITNISLVIPIIWSCIVNGQSILPIHLVGIGLLVIAFIISAFSSSDKKSGGVFGNISFKWVILVFIAFLFNGTTAVLQNIDSNMVENPTALFLIVGYFVAGLCFLIIFLVSDRNYKFNIKEYYSSPLALIAVVLVAGLGSQIGNRLLGELCTKVDGAILYPSINGGLAVMVSLISFIFFKEKVNAKKVIAILIGCMSIILLNLS